MVSNTRSSRDSDRSHNATVTLSFNIPQTNSRSDRRGSTNNESKQRANNSRSGKDDNNDKLLTDKSRTSRSSPRRSASSSRSASKSGSRSASKSSSKSGSRSASRSASKSGSRSANRSASRSASRSSTQSVSRSATRREKTSRAPSAKTGSTKTQERVVVENSRIASDGTQRNWLGTAWYKVKRGAKNNKTRLLTATLTAAFVAACVALYKIKGDQWIAEHTGIRFETPEAFKKWLNASPFSTVLTKLEGLKNYLTPYLSQATEAVRSVGEKVATTVTETAKVAAETVQNVGKTVASTAAASVQDDEKDNPKLRGTANRIEEEKQAKAAQSQGTLSTAWDYLNRAAGFKGGKISKSRKSQRGKGAVSRRRQSEPKARNLKQATASSTRQVHKRKRNTTRN